MKKVTLENMPKYTRDRDYLCNVSWDYLAWDLIRYRDEFKLQLHPKFQRGNVWNERQQIAYIEYKLKGGYDGNFIYFNHPGWMKLFDKKEGYHDFVLVDGLQRITAVIKFLNNHLKAFGCYCKQFELPNKRFGFNTEFKFVINNLQTEKEVLQWYHDLNFGGTPHSEKERKKILKLIERSV